MVDKKFSPLEEIDIQSVKQPSTVAYTKKGKKKSAEKPTIHCIHVLDSSGSMVEGYAPTKYDNAVSGLKEEIMQLSKDDTANYTYSLIEFGGYTLIKEQFYKVKEAPTSVLNSLTNFRSMTALNDAVAHTLLKAKSENNGKDKYLISILTDGGENDSKKFPADKRGNWNNTANAELNALIKECEALGFTITFIGVEKDVENMVTNYNIAASNTLTYDGSAAGLKLSSEKRTRSTIMYSKAIVDGADVTKGFYTEIHPTVKEEKKTKKSTKTANSNV